MQKIASFVNSFRKINRRVLQQEIDTARAFQLTEYYKLHKSQIRKVNEQPDFKYEEKFDQQVFLKELDKLSERVIQEATNTNISKQILDLFQFIEKNGDMNPYPAPVQFHQRKQLRNINDVLNPELKKQLRDQLENLIYKAGTPIHHPDKFVLQIRKSKIDHPESGYGVFIQGSALPGTVLAIYPGLVYYPSHIDAEVIKDNEYMMSRYDNIIIDGRNWDQRATEIHEIRLHNSKMDVTLDKIVKKFRNPFGIGNYVNHPAAEETPNVLNVQFNFSTNPPYVLPTHLQDYIPNELFAKSMLYQRLKHNVLIPSVVLMATRHIKDEELLLNYRFNPKLPYPSWYHQPDEEEARRRWTRPNVWQFLKSNL